MEHNTTFQQRNLGIADFNLKDPVSIVTDLKDIGVIASDPVGLALDLKDSIS